MLLPIARGHSTQGIARELFLAPATVKTHVSALLDELAARVSWEDLAAS